MEMLGLDNKKLKEKGITSEEIKQMNPEFTILHAPNFLAPEGTPGINSDVFVIISFED